MSDGKQFNCSRCGKPHNVQPIEEGEERMTVVDFYFTEEDGLDVARYYHLCKGCRAKLEEFVTRGKTNNIMLSDVEPVFVEHLIKSKLLQDMQAWIEMFGSRGSKAIGSGINLFRGFLKSSMGAQAGVMLFITLSTGISLGLIGVWFFAAAYIARSYNKAIKEDTVVC